VTGSKIAFIFPAFAHEYPEESFRGSAHFHKRFYELLGEASRLINPCLERFDPVNNTFLEDEYKTQLVTYVYSSTVSDTLRSGGIHPHFAVGLSMGIYAALYHANSISFETGLRLVSKAWLESIRCLKSKQYGMGGIIGLSEQDAEILIEKNHLQAEITNISSDYSITLSGLFDHIVTLLELARAEGALHTRLLKASVPYHTGILLQARESFRRIVSEMPLRAPSVPVISLVDQKILNTEEEVREELVRNLYTHLHWKKTQEALLEQGVNVLVECGPGRNLAKNARFIKGDFSFRHFSEFVS